MTDDFRVYIRVDGHGLFGELLEGLRAGGVGREVSERLGDRVVVSHHGDELFLYTATEEDARTALEAVRPSLEEHELSVEEERVERWHPDAETWEDASVPLPTTEEQRAAEHAKLVEAEAAASEEAGVPQWEVRVTLAREEDARRYAQQLEEEGLRIVRRSRHVLAGARTEDEARELAERMRAGAPEGARFEVEGNGQAIWPVLHPFAIFGGLGQ